MLNSFGSFLLIPWIDVPIDGDLCFRLRTPCAESSRVAVALRLLAWMRRCRCGTGYRCVLLSASVLVLFLCEWTPLALLWNGNRIGHDRDPSGLYPERFDAFFVIFRADDIVANLAQVVAIEMHDFSRFIKEEKFFKPVAFLLSSAPHHMVFRIMVVYHDRNLKVHR